MHPGVLFEFANGAVAQVTDAERVPLNGGEYWGWRQITYTRQPARSRPGHTVTFEIQNGQIVCTRVEFTSGDAPVMQEHLRALKLEDLGVDVYAHTGMFTQVADGVWMRTYGRKPAGRRARDVKALPKTRDLQLLQRAAEVYRGAVGESKTQRVRLIARELSLSERQAWRYVGKAEEAGLLG